jgi:hypothetical protein
MRMIRRSFEVGLVAVSLLLLAPRADAQRQPRIPAPNLGRRALVPPAAVQRPPRALQNGPGSGLPGNWVDQLQEMQPADQERFLKNNLRFRGLPPQQQDLIRQRLKVWNRLPAEQREALLERQQIWEQLPPDQRRQVRESLLPRWQSLPMQRRQVILGKLRELRGLDGAQRAAKLSDENFLGSMSEEDRQMLRDLSSLGVGQAAG